MVMGSGHRKVDHENIEHGDFAILGPTGLRIAAVLRSEQEDLRRICIVRTALQLIKLGIVWVHHCSPLLHT